MPDCDALISSIRRGSLGDHEELRAPGVPDCDALISSIRRGSLGDHEELLTHPTITHGCSHVVILLADCLSLIFQSDHRNISNLLTTPSAYLHAHLSAAIIISACTNSSKVKPSRKSSESPKETSIA